jgi:LacI family transcriptional regulator
MFGSAWSKGVAAMSTMADVARLAQVSKTTVSHVLNGTRAVHPKTEHAVRQAMEMLAYTPNTIARSLARSVTNSVGVAISAISNFYFGEIVQAIEAECTTLGYTMLVADTHDDPEHELRMVRALHERRVDGVILAPAARTSHTTLHYLSQRRVPTVLIDRAADASFDQVAVENTEAMTHLVDHVAGHGHRRIGLLHGLSGLVTSDERALGFQRALSNRSLDRDPRLVVDGRSAREPAEHAVEQLLDLHDPPTAIVSGNNQMTIGAMIALRRRGLMVPRDIALVGFDDFEWSDLFEPRLTVVAQPCTEIGQTAMQLLRTRIEGPDHPPTTVRPAATLRVRTSCGCP